MVSDRVSINVLTFSSVTIVGWDADQKLTLYDAKGGICDVDLTNLNLLVWRFYINGEINW
jgi:hypothetical protein